MTLDADTKAVLVGAGVMFLIALALGVWKYQQMATAESHLAHPYVDTAHRAALLYSFATLLVAAFVQFSGFRQKRQCRSQVRLSGNSSDPVGSLSVWARGLSAVTESRSF